MNRKDALPDLIAAVDRMPSEGTWPEVARAREVIRRIGDQTTR